MDDISAVLRATLEDMAGVPDGLKEIAFAKVFDLRAGTAARPQPPAPEAQGTGLRQQTSEQQTDRADTGDPLAAVAAKAGTARDVVTEVLDITGDSAHLIVPTGKLPPQTASATKEIALVIAGARQASGLDEWTSWDVIRDVCADFKRLDSGNFAKTIRSMENEFKFRKESERKMLVQLSRPGWESFSVLIKRLGGDST